MNTETKRAEILKIVCLGVSYAFSYAYINIFSKFYSRLYTTVYLTLLAVGAIVWLELTIRQKCLTEGYEPTQMQKVESRFWEGILLLLCIGTYQSDFAMLSYFFIHMVVIYMALCGTRHLLEDSSSCLMPLDLINGCVRIPFQNIFYRIKTWVEIITHRKKEDTDGNSSIRTIGIISIIGIFGLFFLIALENLASLDANFRYLERCLDDYLMNLSLGDFIGKFIASLPVGAFLFGLFQGGVRLDDKKEKDYRQKLSEESLHFRIMPNILFSLMIGVFILVYLAFFISQSGYMFSAFAGVLPEKYTASQYAVSGFHELINVVILNFVLLICVRFFGSHESRLLRILSVILMAESMVFACISASKIILYMSRFGYTLSRTLGLWGTIVVFVGAICAIVYLLKEKRTFLPWLWFSAGSYVILQFITWAFV